MKNINVVVLTGNLASDPELRQGHSGARVSTLRVANNLRRKRDDAWTDKTSFFDVEVWGANAEACVSQLEKGSRVAVQGEIEIDEWRDRSGERRERAVIRQATVTFEGRRLVGQPRT
jgi:single-strand DNA-binding protein